MNDPSEVVPGSFKVPRYLMEALQNRAKAEHRSVNQQINVILEESLEAPKGDSHV